LICQLVRNGVVKELGLGVTNTIKMATKVASQLDGRGTGFLGFFAVYSVLSAIGVYFLRIDSASSIVPDAMQAVKEAGHWRGFGHDVPVRSHYTGIWWLDFGLTFLVVAFMPGAGALDTGFWIQQLYFLVSFFAVISIWTVEACRDGNRKRITS
jgi:hypothetical protein